MGEAAKKTVIIIDDDDSVRQAMERLMRSAGLEVRVFASAAAFLASDYLKKNVCLVVDIQMPNASGLDLQKTLLEKGESIPVIFITAFDTDEVRKLTKSMGAAGYFRKPVDSEALLDAIEYSLANS